MEKDKDGDKERRQATTWAVHILFIVIIFVLPELVMTISRPHRGVFLLTSGFYLRTLYYIAVFYLNYFLIVDSTISRRSGRSNFWFFALYNTVLILIGLVLSYTLTHNMMDDKALRHFDRLKYLSFLLRDAAMIILTIGLAVAIRLSARWHDIESRRRRLQSEQQATELASLKHQLNPHFLFNSLNTVYALIDTSPADARGAVHRLSGMLRYVLYEDVKTVRLSQEVDFIENYVALMRLRMSNRTIRVETDIEGYGDTLVPPLLFIPLVENAFKYGNEDSSGKPIELAVKATADGIECSTSNGIPNTRSAKEKESGIGLTNLRRRLSLVYGGKASFTVSEDDDTFTAKLTIPLSSNG